MIWIIAIGWSHRRPWFPTMMNGGVYEGWVFLYFFILNEEWVIPNDGWISL